MDGCLGVSEWMVMIWMVLGFSGLESWYLAGLWSIGIAKVVFSHECNNLAWLITAEHVHFVCTLGFGIGSKGLLPLMLLAITSVLATTLAAPDLINGLHGMTNNLAAWELSHLAGWRFLRGRLLQWYSRTAVWYPYRPRSRRTASSAIRSYRRYRWSLS